MKTFYEIMLTSSALILGVLFLRSIGKKRISARCSYFLWIPVIGKLLLFPKPIWNVKFSILKLETVFRTKLQTSTLPKQLNQTKQIVQSAVRNVGESTLHNKDAGWSIVLGIWIAGMIIVTLWLIFNNHRMHQFLVQNRRYIQRYNGRRVYVVRGLANSCLYLGSIYIDEELLEEQQKQGYVLLHEYCHFKQLDDVWAIVRAVCLILYWYHPLVWLAALLSKRDCEIACDELVLRYLGEQHRIKYGETLLYFVSKYQEQRKSVKNLLVLNTSINGGKKEMKERISYIVGHKKTSIIMSLIIAGLLITLTGCTFSGNQSQESDIAADVQKETTSSQSEMASAKAETTSSQETTMSTQEEKATIMIKDGETGRVCTATLKVRDAASSDSEVVGLLGEGDEITVLGKENGYYKITYEDKGDAYVDVQYITSEEE